MVVAFILIGLSIACYSVKELIVHGKFKFENTKEPSSFWGGNQYRRKYKNGNTDLGLIKAPENLYYKLIGSKYKERWITSTWLTVAFTDAMHLFQSLSFLLLSLGISMLSGISFWIIWPVVLITHATIYRILQR